MRNSVLDASITNAIGAGDAYAPRSAMGNAMGRGAMPEMLGAKDVVRDNAMGRGVAPSAVSVSDGSRERELWEVGELPM